MHAIIKKWVQCGSAHLVRFDYCQFGTEWKKATTVLSVGNKNFHTGNSVRCDVTWKDDVSLCSKSGKPHTTLSGFIGDATKGQYKTNRACPYPVEFCTYVANFIAKPVVHFASRIKKGEIQDNVEKIAAMPVGPAVSMQAPPADHYLTHLPKHPGCKACMNCKVQRKHCRDHNKARQRKLVDVSKTDKSDVLLPHEKVSDDPKKFGDLVTSDSVFAIKRNSTNPARVNETTTLVVRDKATGWLAAYPAKRKSAEEILEAVNNFKGSETIARWYSDGAPELHSVCRKLGIRHDISDPHRSETNGLIDRTNRTLIEGARCLLFESGMPYKYWNTAVKCFADNYNFTHFDSKRGTNGHIERLGKKFG